MRKPLARGRPAGQQALAAGGIVTVGSRRRAPWDGRADAAGRPRTGYGAAEPRPSPLRPQTPRARRAVPGIPGRENPPRHPACRPYGGYVSSRQHVAGPAGSAGWVRRRHSVIRRAGDQSMWSTALPPMRRFSRASIAGSGWRHEHWSSTWPSSRPPAASAHRRVRSSAALAWDASSSGRFSV